MLIEAFVRQMVKGCELSVPSGGGGSQQVVCSLDADLKSMWVSTLVGQRYAFLESITPHTSTPPVLSACIFYCTQHGQ